MPIWNSGKVRIEWSNISLGGFQFKKVIASKISEQNSYKIPFVISERFIIKLTQYILKFAYFPKAWRCATENNSLVRTESVSIKLWFGLACQQEK